MSGVFVHFINTSLFITIYGQNWYCNCIRLLTSNIYWCWIWTSWNMSSFHIFIDILLTTFMFQSLIEAFLLKKKKEKSYVNIFALFLSFDVIFSPFSLFSLKPSSDHFGVWDLLQCFLFLYLSHNSIYILISFIFQITINLNKKWMVLLN